MPSAVVRSIAARSFAIALMAAVLCGCSAQLETGYQPRKLGSSSETRRGYYAPPFTPEAKAARQYEQDFGAPNGGRPRPGY
jgi:hypothetical protein